MISNVVKYIHDNFWDHKLPVDVDKIAKDIGLEVDYSHKEPKLSGMFEYVNDVPVCTINIFDSRVRQRFTLAHEIGHYALQHGKSFRDPLNIIDNLQPKEVAANQFAAELLMPSNLVNGYVKKGWSIADMAKEFAVSQSAMSIRLRTLGWL